MSPDLPLPLPLFVVFVYNHIVSAIMDAEFSARRNGGTILRRLRRVFGRRHGVQFCFRQKGYLLQP